VKCYDPAAQNEAIKLFGKDKMAYSDGLFKTLDNVDAVILLTCWEEFRSIPNLIAQKDPQPLIIDARRMLDKRTIKRYEGIGL
jgi:UDPglucose 6-dehydrogenase